MGNHTDDCEQCGADLRSRDHFDDCLLSRLAAVTAERDAVRELLRRAKPEIYLDSHGNPELVKEIDAALAAPAGEVQP
jgi:hypothetical protein